MATNALAYCDEDGPSDSFYRINLRNLHKGDYLMVNSKVCSLQVRKVSRVGKHGIYKHIITSTEVITGKDNTTILPGNSPFVHAPYVTSNDYIVENILENGRFVLRDQRDKEYIKHVWLSDPIVLMQAREFLMNGVKCEVRVDSMLGIGIVVLVSTTIPNIEF